MTTVDNAVAVDRFPPAVPGDGPPTVLFVGVVCRRKGTLELARASRLLRERGVLDWRLVVVGGQGPTPPEEYAEIVAEFAAAGLADALVGPEYGEQVRQRLQAADVVVLRSDRGGQPMAILEALGAGVPVVMSSVGAFPAVTSEGVDGRVLDPADVAALADALADLVQHPDRRRAMAAAARRRAEQAHDLPRLSARLTSLYAEVLEDRLVVTPDLTEVTA